MKQRSNLIIALSGGPDSVYLFHHLLAQHHSKQITLRAVHVNHGWRDSAADDEQFCRDLCTQHNIPLTVAHAADWQHRVPAHKSKNSSPESLAREIRRVIFAHEHATHNADAVVLAHHRDDQLETFFIRLLRGASLSGLCGMQPRADIYLRPLLDVSKTEILSWLAEHNHTYCHDETNDSAAHLRNRIRQQVLPALTSADARAPHTITNTMKRLKDDDDFLAQLTNDLIAELRDEGGQLPRETFCQLHSALQHRILLQLFIAARAPIVPTSALLAEVIRFLSSPNGGRHEIAPGVAIVKQRGFFSVV